MIVAFTSFTISFVAILGMLLMKAREIKNQKKYFVSKIAVKTDNFFSEIFTNIKKLLSYINRPHFCNTIFNELVCSTNVKCQFSLENL